MAALDDIAFLARSPNRVAALEVLTGGPRERSDLRAELGVSQSTIKRVLGGLTERGWVVNRGGRCEITPLGERVVAGFTSLVETIEAESNLRRVVEWLPTAAPEFDVELFTDGTVTTAEPGAPYRPYGRLMELADETASSTIRAFGTRPLPGYFEKWDIEEGTTSEVIFSPVVVDALRRTQPADTQEVLESGRLVTLVHEDLPCGLVVYEGHVAICGYDRTTGMLHAVIDTDDPAAVEWGEETYETYRREARPVDLTASTS